MFKAFRLFDSKGQLQLYTIEGLSHIATWEPRWCRGFTLSLRCPQGEWSTHTCPVRHPLVRRCTGQLWVEWVEALAGALQGDIGG